MQLLRCQRPNVLVSHNRRYVYSRKSLVIKRFLFFEDRPHTPGPHARFRGPGAPIRVPPFFSTWMFLAFSRGSWGYDGGGM